MPKEDNTINVQAVPFEPLRYLVESWSDPKRPYLVDLAENHGNGACSCKDFVTRRQPAIRQGSPLFTKATSCRHVVAARKHFTIKTLTDIAAMVTAQEKAPQPPANPPRSLANGYD